DLRRAANWRRIMLYKDRPACQAWHATWHSGKQLLLDLLGQIVGRSGENELSPVISRGRKFAHTGKQAWLFLRVYATISLFAFPPHWRYPCLALFSFSAPRCCSPWAQSQRVRTTRQLPHRRRSPS